MPKTLRNKFNEALTYEKLMESHLKSQKGKTNRKNVIKFNMKKEEYIDRIIHRWCYDNFLENAFVPQFIYTSYACIKGRGMHRAALAVQNGMKQCQKKYKDYYILKMDIAKYFSNIDKDILMGLLKLSLKSILSFSIIVKNMFQE